jgi:hypothetical protein
MNDLERKTSISRSQWSLIFLILAVSASVRYRLIVRGRLEQTAVSLNEIRTNVWPARITVFCGGESAFAFGVSPEYWF